MRRKAINTQLTANEQHEIEAMEEKTRYPGFEVLVRVVVSSNTSARSQALLQNIISAFCTYLTRQASMALSLRLSKNIDSLVTAYIFRFFPQSVTSNI